jgi:hypothetical protein
VEIAIRQMEEAGEVHEDPRNVWAFQLRFGATAEVVLVATIPSTTVESVYLLGFGLSI